MKRIVLVTVFASLLLFGAISNQSFGATGHSYVLDWGGFGFSYEGQFFMGEYSGEGKLVRRGKEYAGKFENHSFVG